MVERIAHRDLRNRSSEILRDVAAGATYEITNHGEVVAIISPPGRRPPLRYREATIQGRWDEIPCVRREERSEDALAALRGER